MSILHWFLLTALLSLHHSDYVIGSSTRNSIRISSVYCPNPIGVADRDIISDSSFTATSSSINGYQAHQARLHGGPRGWAPRANTNPNDYLQIDLGEEFIVCAVATQGCRIHEERVTEYKISTSTDGKSWSTYKNDGKDKLFPGNLLNSNDVKTNVLDPPVDLRFIRFIPTKFSVYKVLRVEVYGNKKYSHPNPIGVSNSSIIPNHRFTATSHYNSSYTPYHARLYDDYGWAPKTTSNPNDYLQIDLGAVFVINALSTQGSSITNEWTTEYKISTSIENKTWSMYRETGGKVKMFPVDLLRSNDVKTNVLDPPADARFIRFIPTNYSGYKVLRVEVYGILKVTLQGVRLSGGSTPNQGYLEVKIDGQWGKICARSWTLREAKIACNMLGMTGKASPWSPPLISELPTIMNLKRCNGDETALQDCTFVESGLKNCSPFLVRGVTCGPPSVYIAIVENADKLYLERSVYIHTVTLNRSCQAKNASQYILPIINVYDTKSGRSILCNVTMDTRHEQIAKCGADFKTNAVRIRSSDKNATLKLCDEPDVSAFDNATNIRGVLYDLWKKHTKLDDSSILKLHDVFSGPADISSISPSFIITGLSGLSNYSLREQGYVMVNTPGVYFISASCGDECEVWLRRAEEPGLNYKETDDELLIKIESPTNPNLYKLSRSQYKFENFSKCHLYYMEAYMRQRVNQDYLTVVVKLPNEQKIQLFPHEFLYWMRPGSRVLKFRSTNKISTKIALGSEITFEAVYEFCCKGLLCPSCSLVLQLHAFDQSIVVNRSLEMNCQEYKMTHTFVVVVQPGNYSIDIIYRFLDDITHWQGKRTIVKSIKVSDSTRLQCYFNRECPGWIVSSNTSSTPYKWSLDGSGSIAITSPGVSFLESPSMPWKSDYEHIKLCVEFSYLLPTNTSSRLEVFRKTTSSKELLWLLSGYHGTVWQRAYIPVMSEEDFQITFSGDSKVNGSIAMAIRDFQVTSRSCKLRPVFAKPESQCKVTEFKCQNGQCVNKNQRCNGIHGDCLDDSDENKCVCQTDQFSCFNDKCIKYKSLCDEIPDCPNGEDEANCDKKCSLQQCLDGTYGSCGQLTSCNATNYQPCDVDAVKYTSLNATRCQIHRGVCGFDNELCGFQIDTKSPLVWDFFKPVDFQSNKHDFPNYDHTSMTDQERYMLLKSNENTQTGFGRLLKDWNTVRIFCMQFWYFIPDNSDSFLEIAIDTATSTKLLWKTSNSTSGDWAYGQVQIPGNLRGKIIITGYVNTSFVAIDDFGLADGGCASVYSQRNPSCYFEKKDACTWDVENPWTQSKLPVVYESHNLIKGPAYPYLVLSKSEKKRSTISSPFIHPAEGWRCLRFWFYSGKKYFERKLTVEYQTDKKTTEEWSYESETDKWTFIQLPIPEIQEPLQVKINGKKDNNNAILAIKDLTFTKEHCLKIPAHQECHEYKTLSFSDRRKDTIAEYEMFKGCDDHLSRKAWYRVVDSAGNELARSCVKRSSSCSTDYMGWINGSLPSVGHGIVERQLCFASESKCCSKNTTVKIRNCKEFFVYQFPKKVPPCPSKYCSVYRHECEDQPIGIANSSIVPDDRFTATSQYSHAYKPYYARLNSVARGWAPKTTIDPNDYLQIDLGAVFVICAVATQGHSMINEWTTEYKIATSTDNKTWAMYRQNGGEVKLFSGNRDGHTVVKNALNDTRTHARFIRFIPTKYYSFKVFRVEVYGYIKGKVTI